MPRSYSRDLRERLVHAVASGVPMVEIERTTGVSARSISRWKQKQEAGTSLAPGRPPGRPRRITADETAALRAQVAATPDATLAEHCAAWVVAGHAPLSLATMCRALARLGLTPKKRR